MISFTKAHACGNDFLIVTEEAAYGFNRADLARRLCARNSGVGADGIEFFEWTGPRSGRIHLHNADGSVAEISGNGTRCVAAWMAFERGFQPGDDGGDCDRCRPARMPLEQREQGRWIHRGGEGRNGHSNLRATHGDAEERHGSRGRRGLDRQSAFRGGAGYRGVRG